MAPNNGDFSASVLTSLLSSKYFTTDSFKKFKVTLRLAVYRQSVRLGVKRLETHNQRLFFFS
jgi:hypothetical protein